MHNYLFLKDLEVYYKILRLISIGQKFHRMKSFKIIFSE